MASLLERLGWLCVIALLFWPLTLRALGVALALYLTFKVWQLHELLPYGVNW